jgi:hypothetical protein
LDLVFQDQLFEKGEDAKGKKLPMPYSPFTIEKNKKPNNLPYNRITLYQTGSFHNKSKLIIENDNIKITSTDDKKDKLVQEWGDILNLQEQNLNEVRWNLVYPDLTKYLRNALRV